MSEALSPATGQNPVGFVLTNRGSGVCHLHGYPAVAILSKRGGRIPFVTSHRGDQMVTSERPRLVEIAPHQSAFLLLNHYRCDLGNVSSGKRLRVSLPHSGTLSQTLPGSGIAYCGPGDPGSVLAVSPVEPTLRAALAFG